MKTNILRITLAAALAASGPSTASELVLTDEILFALPGASFDPEEAPLVFAPGDRALTESSEVGPISGVELTVNSSAAIDFVELAPSSGDVDEEDLFAESLPTQLYPAVFNSSANQTAPTQSSSILRDTGEMEVAAVPEPALSIFGVLGGTLLLLIRRRKLS